MPDSFGQYMIRVKMHPTCCLVGPNTFGGLELKYDNTGTGHVRYTPDPRTIGQSPEDAFDALMREPMLDPLLFSNVRAPRENVRSLGSVLWNSTKGFDDNPTMRKKISAPVKPNRAAEKKILVRVIESACAALRCMYWR